MNISYVSLFSGIEAASCAWHPLGWGPVAFAEIEPFPSAVLAHRFPDVPNLGDITRVDWSAYAGVDVLVGGSPCQSFSVAGLRKGLADPRGNLALEYLRAVDAVRPRWVVWENVPGVLSADGGRAFGTFIGGLAELGYGFAYRVLDAQYVRVESHPRAVPQRRRRVFVVGCLGDWRRAAAVLLERESLRGHPAPRREATAGAAPAIAQGIGACSSFDRGDGSDTLIPESIALYSEATLKVSSGVCHTLRARTSAGGVQDAVAIPEVAHSLRADGFDASEDGTGRGTPIVMAPAFSKRPGQQIATRDDGSRFALTAGEPPRVLAFAENQRGELRTSDVAMSLSCAGGKPGSGYPAIQQSYAVRRLTPLECERLQGFPDSWTDVPYRGKQAADGPRYKAIGNSMAVNVMSFIGQRIEAAS